MATKKYLYKKTTGEWVFGAQKNSICPAGVHKLEINGAASLTIRYIFNRNAADDFNASVTDFLQENDQAYATLEAFIAATSDFFSTSINISTGDVTIGAVSLKDATADTRVKVAAGNTIAANNNAAAVADPNTKAAVDLATAAVEDTTAAITSLMGKQFPAGIHLLSGTDPAGAGTYAGFIPTGDTTTISSITLTDATKVTGDNDFSGMTLVQGMYYEIPGGFSNITLSAGNMILVKA